MDSISERIDGITSNVSKAMNAMRDSIISKGMDIVENGSSAASQIKSYINGKRISILNYVAYGTTKTSESSIYYGLNSNWIKTISVLGSGTINSIHLSIMEVSDVTFENNSVLIHGNVIDII